MQGCKDAVGGTPMQDLSTQHPKLGWHARNTITCCPNARLLQDLQRCWQDNEDAAGGSCKCRREGLTRAIPGAGRAAAAAALDCAASEHLHGTALQGRRGKERVRGALFRV